MNNKIINGVKIEVSYKNKKGIFYLFDKYAFIFLDMLPFSNPDIFEKKGYKLKKPFLKILTINKTNMSFVFVDDNLIKKEIVLNKKNNIFFINDIEIKLLGIRYNAKAIDDWNL